MEGRITALKAQQRNPQRVNVFLDDEYAFSLARITAAWLHVGQELSAEKIAELQNADQREKALQRALHLLEYRPRAEAEIQRKLTEHDVPPEVIAEVLERLRQGGLVDDARFAAAWIENRNQFRPRSRRALAVEMRRRGLSDEVIQQALIEVDDDQEENLAYQAASKQVRRLAGLERPVFQQRLGGFLARRGFGYPIIRAVVDRLWQENQTLFETETQ